MTGQSIQESKNTNQKVMSDSIKKWHEMVLDGTANVESRKDIKSLAYQILIEFPEEAIETAYRILQSEKNHS